MALQQGESPNEPEELLRNMQENCQAAEDLALKTMALQQGESPNEPEELLRDMQENCQAAEDLALKTIYSQHVPLLNSMRCLTKADCWNILNKYRCFCSVTEQSILLIALTDFITCVCANAEMFPLFIRKYDKKGIKSLLMLLQSHWNKLFTRITPKDINVRQMTSVVALMKHCADRVSGTSNKIFLDVMLRMAERTLFLLKNPPDTFLTKYDTLKQEDKSHDVEPKTKKIHISNVENRAKIKPNVAKVPSRSTKCVLKPRENNATNVQGKESQIHQRIVADQGISKPAISDGWKTSSKPHKHIEMKAKLITNLDAPQLKKRCLEENLINTKANAFERLMNHSKSMNLKESSQPSEVNKTSCKKEPKNAFELMMQNANKRRANQK